MQTFKKPPLTVLLCLIVCFTLTSCFNTKNKSESVPDNYSLYSQYVDKVVKKFEPEGFEILNSTADIYSSGFPENEYFEERDDLYDGNPLQPKNRKAIYLNSTNGILACMTFLYSEEELGKRMLTIKKHTKWFWKINTVLCCLNLSQLSHCRAIKSKQLPATEHQ